MSSLSGSCIYRGCKWGDLHRHFNDYSDAELISDLGVIQYHCIRKSKLQTRRAHMHLVFHAFLFVSYLPLNINSAFVRKTFT